MAFRVGLSGDNETALPIAETDRHGTLLVGAGAGSVPP